MATALDVKPFRQITRDRMLVEMLRDVRIAGSSDWKVLITDEFTLRVLSAACKMADVTEEGISLVEDLNKRRQPLPQLDAVYFIQPTQASVERFMSDMSGSTPLYKRAYVFFSSPVVRRELLQRIKSDTSLRPRIAALKEMNLEYLTVDMQGFVTDQAWAFERLFGDRDASGDYERTVDSIASRLGTVFASLKEFPAVRYRAAKTALGSASAGERARDLVPTKVASALWDRLMKYRGALPGFPQSDTCDLLILDRTTDVVAPMIHDWSYGGMVFDLLPVDGNKYQYEVVTGAGRVERKTVLLDEHDAIWVELRDLFIADAFQKITVVSQELAARTMSSERRAEMSAKEMSALIKSLPQYREQKDKVELHVNIANEVNKELTRQGLNEIGKLEQGFVYDESKALYKELANLLSSMQGMEVSNKLRLLLIYAATHPDKFDATKRLYWQKLAQLANEDMAAVTNLEYLGIPVGRKVDPPPTAAPAKASGFSLGFGRNKAEKPVGARRERSGGEGAFELARFNPLLLDVVEEMAEGSLSREQYPFVEEPRGGGSSGVPQKSQSAAAPPGGVKQGQSVRGGGGASGGGAGATWASRGSKPSEKQGSHSHHSSQSSIGGGIPQGRRIFVYIAGGMTRSEMKVAHTLTNQLNREVVIGSTSVHRPLDFLEKLKELSKLVDIPI